jgi:hypothetical protein
MIFDEGKATQAIRQPKPFSSKPNDYEPMLEGLSVM